MKEPAPVTTTDPDHPDTDRGGVPDGIEDADGDGRLDPGEGDPLDPVDDVLQCSFAEPPEVTNLRLSKLGAAPLLTWDDVTDDRCTTYSVLRSLLLPDWSALATDLVQPRHLDATAAGGSPLVFYLLRADSSAAGPGPTGR